MDRATRYSYLDPHESLSTRAQAKLLQIPRGKYFYRPKGMDSFNLYMTRLIDEQYQRTPFYGVPRMTEYLNSLGVGKVNPKRIERLYKLMDISALGPNPNTSKSDRTTYKYPYLLRNLKIDHPNQVWVADITVNERLHVSVCDHGSIYQIYFGLGYI